MDASQHEKDMDLAPEKQVFDIAKRLIAKHPDYLSYGYSVTGTPDGAIEYLNPQGEPDNPDELYVLMKESVCADAAHEASVVLAEAVLSKAPDQPPPGLARSFLGRLGLKSTFEASNMENPPFIHVTTFEATDAKGSTWILQTLDASTYSDQGVRATQLTLTAQGRDIGAKGWRITQMEDDKGANIYKMSPFDPQSEIEEFAGFVPTAEDPAPLQEMLEAMETLADASNFSTRAANNPSGTVIALNFGQKPTTE